MDQRQSKRAQKTREQIREAAQRLFLQNGYLATSTDAILAEAGVSSKETLYRHYGSKEELFVAVLSHMTLEQPGLSEHLAEIAIPRDIAMLRQALTTIAHEILLIMMQPEYIALLRIVIAEMTHFPQLGSLFRQTVPQRGFLILSQLLQQAREQNIIADIDIDATIHTLIGGLLAYLLTDIVFAEEVAQRSQSQMLERSDAVVEIIMQALS
jgi:AcrR family transcriptional regulator